jgi:Fic family protein
MNNFSHISFRLQWELSNDISYMLGQCNATIKALSEIPMEPDYRALLLNLSLIKGAQSTTAIEGNTLSEEEIINIQKGKNLPPSKAYQQKEVENIIDAFNILLNELVIDNKDQLISPEFILRLHKMVGRDLGENFNAIPGEFRNHNIFVGRYRGPDHKEVIPMIQKLCDWMKTEFHYERGQHYINTVIQAIVLHVYIAWIHPFGDGNGRTARLLEFYILLRAGNPDFASHLLSNFYNETRSEYYRHLDNSTKTGNLNEFLKYAIQGYRDGLYHIIDIVQTNQMEISWRNYIYNVFKTKRITAKTEGVNKRRRDLIISLPIGSRFNFKDITKLSVEIALTYNNLSGRTINRDIQELVNLDLLIENDDGTFSPNLIVLKKFIARRKKNK